MVKQVHLDRNSVRLKAGQRAEIKITNTAAAEVSLSVPDSGPAGIEAKFDTAKLAAGGKATLTLRAAKGAKSGVVNLHVDQASQPIPIRVTILK